MRNARWGLFSAIIVLAAFAGVFMAARARRQHASISQLPPLNLERFTPTARRLVSNKLDELKKEPLAVERWATLGYVLAANGDAASSAACFKRCADLDRSNGRWPYLYAANVLPSDRQAAIDALKQTLQLRPDADGARAMLAELHLDDGADAEAAALLNPRVTDDCHDPRLLLAAARVAANAGESDRAILAAARAAELAPHRRAIHALLAQLYARKGDTEKLRIENRILELLPPVDQEGPWPDATLQQVSQFNRSVEAITSRARMLRETGRVDEALQLLNEIAPEERSTPHVVAAFALARSAQGDFDAAYKLLDGIASEEQFRFLSTRAFVKVMQEKYAEAADLFLQAATSGEGKRSLDSPYYNRGVCFEMLMRVDDAFIAYERALAANPGHLDALKRLAAIYVKRQRRADARRLLADAELLAPADPTVRELKRSADG